MNLPITHFIWISFNPTNLNIWVKWVLTQLNPININVYWVLIEYPIRPNYDPTIISTNYPTLKCPKTTKITKIPHQPKK